MPISRIKGFQGNILETLPTIRKEIEADILRIEGELRQAHDDLEWVDRMDRANRPTSNGDADADKS